MAIFFADLANLKWDGKEPKYSSVMSRNSDDNSSGCDDNRFQVYGVTKVILVAKVIFEETSFDGEEYSRDFFLLIMLLKGRLCFG